MFTLEEINNEKENYVAYSSNLIPDIMDVKYDLNGDTNGRINSSEIQNKDIILHLNKAISKYHIKYQTSILWHEFTHIYDELNCKYQDNLKKSYMKTLSEMKATSFEHRYLLSLKKYENVLYDTKTKIHFMNYHKDFESILDFYNKSSQMYFTKLANTKSPKDFDSAFNSFMYLCGATRITRHSPEYIKNMLKQYPNDFSIMLAAIVDLIYENNEIAICEAYETFQRVVAESHI